MLVVSVDLWPFGQKEKASNISKLAIANVGRGVSLNPNEHDYVWYYTEPTPLIGKAINESGIIRNYYRQAPASNLLSEVFKDINGEAQPGILSEQEYIIAKKIKEMLSK